jgi:hybrid cluster-associated redox disulfide protein
MTSPSITADMRVLDIVTLVPQAAAVMAEWGLHCSGCSMGGQESLGDGCQAHGLGEEDVTLLLQDIEDARRTMPARPPELHITAAAARAVRALAEQEGKLEKGSVWSETGGLAVILDDQGGFCMEFCDHPEEGDRVFIHAEVPDVRFFVSVLALGRIGGATVDMREGRFKLDLPEDPCACSSHDCACERIEKREQRKE